MDIQEAIQHCLNVAAGATKQGKCPECAADHKQLAEWLAVLKQISEIFNCDPNDPAQLKQICDKLRGWQQAERDGRLVVLPCKVGDLLYEVDLPEYGVITCKVLSIMYYKGPMFHVPGNEVVSSVDVEVEVIEGHGKGSSYNFEIGDFGKTVFLTRQEAEAAAKEVQGHEQN